METIQIGAMCRIADATEQMATNYVQMQRDLEYYKWLAKSRMKECERLKHSRAGYMAALTKLRRQRISIESAERRQELEETDDE
ncbi:MAG: hypothetical protein ABI539_01675 [Acidobacteriota bacterium]